MCEAFCDAGIGGYIQQLGFVEQDVGVFGFSLEVGDVGGGETGVHQYERELGILLLEGVG